jgi:signal transduction histidine kinase
MSDDTIQHLARELHDETGQALTTLTFGLRSLALATSLEEARKRAALLEEVATNATKELARLLRELTPIAVEKCKVCSAIERHVVEFSAIHDIRVALVIDGLERIDGHAPLSSAVLRTLQEALTNVAKHAEATEVSVVLRASETHVRMVVEDNGRGFSVGEEPSKGWGGRGLPGMRQRVLFLGGAIEIDSAPGEGCTIAVELPLVRDHFRLSGSAHGFARQVSR